jgi:tetratricopeptide (TPR) repeat protein
MADSGAFYNLMSSRAAAEFHLKLAPGPFGYGVRGVGGSTTNISVADVKDFEIGGIPNLHVEFVVGGSESGSDLAGLIGRNILNLADAEFDLANGVIRLIKPHECSHALLAYWAKPGGAYGEVDLSQEDEGPARRPSAEIKGTASVNGRQIRVMFDTGAGRSTLALSSARRLGISTTGPGVKPAGASRGIGRRYIATWITPVDDFAIGGEDIMHTQLRIGDFDIPGVDMILGADFFLSHHVFVANSQHKLYFTYNGGPVFDLSAGPAAAAPGESAEADPTDAAGLARRASVRAARGDLPGAISDYSKAMALDPKSADYPLDRGITEQRAEDSKAASADFDRTVSLDPANWRARLARAEFRLHNHDVAAALTDLEAADKALSVQANERLLLGTLYLGAAAPDRALPSLDAWVSLHPDDVGLSGALAARCFARGLLNVDLARAEADCQRSLRLSPGDLGANLGRGFVRIRRGDLDGALADFNIMLAKRKDESWALWGRGLAEQKKGQAAQAKADFTAAVAARPGIDKEAERFGLGAPKT